MDIMRHSEAKIRSVLCLMIYDFPVLSSNFEIRYSFPALCKSDSLSDLQRSLGEINPVFQNGSEINSINIIYIPDTIHAATQQKARTVIGLSTVEAAKTTRSIVPTTAAIIPNTHRAFSVVKSTRISEFAVSRAHCILGAVRGQGT